MSIREDYNTWASTYDADSNTTRDTEHKAFISTISKLKYNNVLELGCGTGKNTIYLSKTSSTLHAVDISPQMIALAQDKVKAKNAKFSVIDISKPWNLGENKFDLITCSLTLEHVPRLQLVFDEAYKHLKTDGYFYIGELHPVKKYLGEGYPRYIHKGKTHRIKSYTHHISKFINYPLRSGFEIISCDDWFKPQNKEVPNIISFVYKKPYLRRSSSIV